MAENDQETTPSSGSGDASTRESYRNLLAQLHEDGTLGDDGYRHRLADVDAARTVGDLETAIKGLDRGDLPVPTRRRQRRELEDLIGEPEPTQDEVPAEEIELDDEDDDDFDDLEIPELPGAAKTADDSDEDDADSEDDEDDDLDAEDEDDVDLDEDDDVDLDEDDEPDTKAVAKRSSSRPAKKSAAGREKKGKATPKRPSAAAKEPEGTGPIQFIKESVAELRKVVYPTSSQLGTYFVVVLVFVLFVIGFTSGIDLGLGKLILMVFG